MPWLREPDINDPVEETWLFEAIIESYIPLLRQLERLADTTIGGGSNSCTRFKIVMSLSPTLIRALVDDYFTKKFYAYFERLKSLARSEIKRNKGSIFEELASFYRKRLGDIEFFLKRSTIISSIRELSKIGCLSLATTAFTHAYLPIFRQYPEMVRLQIEKGRDLFAKIFGAYPKGFWLPECGYYTGVMDFLKNAGYRWTVLEGHGVACGSPVPPEGIFRPVLSPEGVMVFGRDATLCAAVWSRASGYPGNRWYREFYRDICYELDDRSWKKFRKDGIRHHTGFKYYRITGTEQKMPYIRKKALAQIKADAADFMLRLHNRINEANTLTDSPVITLAFDTELFGHWWFEGPEWLSEVIKLISQSENIRFTSPEEFSPETLRCIEPIESSWGEGGFSRTWCMEENSAYLRLIYLAIEEFYSCIVHNNGNSGSPENKWIASGERANHNNRSSLHSASSRDAHLIFWGDRSEGISQEQKISSPALMELLMLQSSDFLFMLTKDSLSKSYARRRLRGHLNRFQKLLLLAQQQKAPRKSFDFLG